MRTDEQLAPSLDPLDGFLISGPWARPVPPRPSGLEEFLAPPPIPDEPRVVSDEIGETVIGAAPPPAAIGGETHQEAHSRFSMGDDWSAIAAIAVQRPQIEARIADSASGPRAIADEAAALAVAEPRALVAPSDVLVEPVSRSPETNTPEGDRDAVFLGALLDDGGLVDSSAWFSVAPESNSPRDSIQGASMAGFHPSRTSTRPLSLGYVRGRSEVGPDRDFASAPHVDRIDESSSEAFEEIEARLSRVAARLESAADRIDSTASFPMGSWTGGFRGRVDE